MYITQVGLAAEMGQYGGLAGELSVSAPKFEHAVRSLASGTVRGFALRTMDVAGGAKAMPLGRWWRTVHAWGQACEVVWAGLDVDLRRASLLPAATRNGPDRTRSARATYERMSGAVLEAAKGTAVLKRPAA